MTSVSASWVGLWKGQVLVTSLWLDRRRDAARGWGGQGKGNRQMEVITALLGKRAADVPHLG